MLNWLKDLKIYRMKYYKIKSHAKINYALNIVGKNSSLHKIESLVGFILLHDDIFIKRIKSKKHKISFSGKFSKNIGKKNTVSKLLENLEKKKLLRDEKFKIKIFKRIPSKAGLGGGSMNAASILKFFIKKKIIQINKNEILNVCKSIGSDVILGLYSTNCIINSKNDIRYFDGCKKFHTLIVKPNFGCATKDIYSKVKKFNKTHFKQPQKKMFNMFFLKKANNSLEKIAFSKYSKLKKIKFYLENLLDPIFVRMTGSGSALVAYYQTKHKCLEAKKKFNKKFKNYWCIASKTI